MSATPLWLNNRKSLPVTFGVAPEDPALWKFVTQLEVNDDEAKRFVREFDEFFQQLRTTLKHELHALQRMYSDLQHWEIELDAKQAGSTRNLTNLTHADLDIIVILNNGPGNAVRYDARTKQAFWPHSKEVIQPAAIVSIINVFHHAVEVLKNSSDTLAFHELERRPNGKCHYKFCSQSEFAFGKVEFDLLPGFVDVTGAYCLLDQSGGNVLVSRNELAAYKMENLAKDFPGIREFIKALKLVSKAEATRNPTIRDAKLSSHLFETLTMTVAEKKGSQWWRKTSFTAIGQECLSYLLNLLAQPTLFTSSIDPSWDLLVCAKQYRDQVCQFLERWRAIPAASMLAHLEGCLLTVNGGSPENKVAQVVNKVEAVKRAHAGDGTVPALTVAQLHVAHPRAGCFSAKTALLLITLMLVIAGCSKKQEIERYFNCGMNFFTMATALDRSDGKYEGSLKNKMRHGWGKMVYGNNDTYEGCWKDDAREGFGIFTTQLESYEGKWQKDRRNGHGSGRFDGDKSYIGAWQADQMHGKGEYRFPNGEAVYTGEMTYDNIEGHGVIKYRSGSTYEGHFQNWNRHGFGVEESSVGRYSGWWKADFKHGQGTLMFTNNNSCEGEWRDDKELGDVTVTLAGGEKLRGYWTFEQDGPVDVQITLYTGNVGGPRNLTVNGRARTYAIVSTTYPEECTDAFTRKRIERLAEAGLKEMQFKLGRCLFFEPEANKSQSFMWLNMSAEQGHDLAQFYVAQCYMDGHGTSQDSEKARHWMEQSVAQGYEVAMHCLSIWLARGKSDADFELGKSLRRRAATVGREYER